jgi:putative transposase
MGANSKIEMYVHFVWSTKYRAVCLSPEQERIVMRCITQEAERLRCAPLAVGTMPDHIHVALRLSSVVCVATLAKQMKGVSSALLNQHRNPTDERFSWQDGYACFSISRPHLERVIAYVRNQKQHHAAGRVWPQWEETPHPTVG